MANNFTTTTGHKNITLFHICSACNNPVIHFCNVNSFVLVKVDGFNTSKPQMHAQKTCNEQIEAAIAKISSCKNDPCSLGALEQPPKQSAWSGIELRTGVDSKTSATTWTSGLVAVCPYCGHQEPWQKKEPLEKPDSIDAEHLPTVFATSERAELAALMWLQKQAEKNASIRLDPDRFLKAQEEYSRLLSEHEAASAALQSTAITDQIASLNDQKQQLEQAFKAAGIFAKKEKKEISARLEQVNGQIDTLQGEEKNRIEDLQNTIRSSALDLGKLEQIFYSSKTDLEAIFSYEAESLRFICTPSDQEGA